MPPGKQASQSEATAALAAGVTLEAMRRRVRLSRLAAWMAIGAGPVALGVAITSTATVVEAAAPVKPAVVRTAAVTADPAGYAQLFLSSWLRSSADDVTSAHARLAQSMAPDVPLPDPAARAQSTPESVIAVRSAQREGGAWLVTVAAQYADGRVRNYAVPVVADRAGSSFTVTGAPGVVSALAPAQAPRSPYGVAVSEGDLSSAVGEFLSAYLTGAGEVSRYLAPGVKLPAVSPAPFTTVTVQEVLAVEEVAAAGQVPADGTTVRVLTQVEAQSADGRWPLGYELALKARSGRWEIASLESGGAQDGGAR
ncbi:conjugal transfer protein [Streptomyces sp. NPDC058434]|uniref:conjugal transfer protein n=1 Tax=Streptomyces sp. NPDC058434 TaxID=3346498 RepID=UPI0036632EC3